MGSSYSDSDGPMATINVTPLVDVMLVLLVIFMITAPILQQGVEVKLPKATTAPLAGNSEQVVVSIDSKGLIYIGSGNKVDLSTLKDKIQAIMATKDEANQKIYVKADEAVSYGTVMALMGKIHAAGVENIGLISDPDK
ncbi:MAG: protein TolR [bacterium]|nr:protein TolR [bacterium]